MKRFIRLMSIIAISILVTVIFSVSVIADTTELSFAGPELCNRGDEIEISLVSENEGLYGVSGILNFDPLFLSFQEISADISGWSVDYNKESGKILFACSDEKANQPSKKKNSILTISLKINDFSRGNTITITATELKASDAKRLLNVADLELTLKNKTFQNNSLDGKDDEYETFYQEGTIADEDNNFLKSLEIKDVVYTPEFTPENKTYEATVPFEIEKVEVLAVPQYEGASVSIEGTELTYIGRNIVKVIVFSESGLKRTYKVYIQRKAPDDKNKSKSKVDFPVVTIIAISIGGLLLLATAIFFTIFLIRRKKKKSTD